MHYIHCESYHLFGKNEFGELTSKYEDLRTIIEYAKSYCPELGIIDEKYIYEVVHNHVYNYIVLCKEYNKNINWIYTNSSEKLIEIVSNSNKNMRAMCNKTKIIYLNRILTYIDSTENQKRNDILTVINRCKTEVKNRRLYLLRNKPVKIIKPRKYYKYLY